MAVPLSAVNRKALSPGTRLLPWLSRYGTILALFLLILFNFAFTPNFATWQTLNINLTQVSTIVIVAIGMTLVIGSGGIDLSVGSLMAIAGALAPLIFLNRIVNLPNIYVGVALAFTIPVLLAGLFGYFNGWLITRFGVQPIVGTLILFIAGRGIAQSFTDSNQVIFTTPEFQFIGLGRVLGIPIQVLIMAAIVALAAWTIRRTIFGKHILAIGGNEAAARLSGVRVARIKRQVYAISGICSGIAGLIVIARNSAADSNLVGLGVELDAIAAVAVGGTLLTGGRAYVFGTLLGALIIQLVRFTLLANGVPDAAALVVKAGLIVLAVWLQRRVTS
jgi:ribose/xylose/arabinose/galactoside ABC-type transport system permease subunit